jgi:uncharacterized protein DUF4260
VSDGVRFRERSGTVIEMGVSGRSHVAPAAMSSVRFWLRAEGLAAFAAGLVLFHGAGGDWLWLVPLLFVPDLSMVGYAFGPGIGSHVYNAVHNWALGVLVLGAGVWLPSMPLAIAGSILIAHVGLDRALGFGLKHPTGFRDTHLLRA